MTVAARLGGPRGRGTRWALALALASPVLSGWACSDGSATAGDVVVVSTSVLGDVVQHVAGPQLAVEVLIGPGVDPHEFAPSARQVADLRDARLVIVNGGGLEESLDETVADAAADGTPVLRALDLVDPIPRRDGEGRDPHFFTDPVRMAALVEVLGERIGDLDGVDRAEVLARARRYGAELVELDQRMDERLAEVPPQRRLLVTEHDTLGYLARRYGFEVLGAVLPGGSTLGAPAASDLADLAAALRARDVPAVFVDAGSSHALAETLASEGDVAVEVVELNTESLGPPGSDSADYVSMLTAAAERIAEALR